MMHRGKIKNDLHKRMIRFVFELVYGNVKTNGSFQKSPQFWNFLLLQLFSMVSWSRKMNGLLND